MLRKGLNHAAYSMLDSNLISMHLLGVGGQKSETSMLKIRRASREIRHKFLQLQSSSWSRHSLHKMERCPYLTIWFLMASDMVDIMNVMNV